MESEMFASLVCFATLLTTFTEASDILLSSTSSSFKPPITRNLGLTCSLKDSALNASSAIVGRRDLTHTDDDVVYVTSIMVMRNGVDIASISEHLPAQMLNNPPNMKVTGKIQGNTGFIELTWLYPANGDEDEYQCDVTGVTKKGHSYTFSKTLEITKDDISLADLSADIALLKKENDALQVEKTTMQGQISTMTGQISTMTGQISTMKGQISSLTSENDDLKKRVSTVETRSLATRTVAHTDCHWTGWVNGYDATFSYMASGSAVIVGVHSQHNNHNEDRQFDFLYCSLTSPHP